MSAARYFRIRSDAGVYGPGLFTPLMNFNTSYDTIANLILIIIASILLLVHGITLLALYRYRHSRFLQASGIASLAFSLVGCLQLDGFVFLLIRTPSPAVLLCLYEATLPCLSLTMITAPISIDLYRHYRTPSRRSSVLDQITPISATLLCLILDLVLIAIIAIADPIRPSASQAGRCVAGSVADALLVAQLGLNLVLLLGAALLHHIAASSTRNRHERDQLRAVGVVADLLVVLAVVLVLAYDLCNLTPMSASSPHDRRLLAGLGLLISGLPFAVFVGLRRRAYRRWRSDEGAGLLESGDEGESGGGGGGQGAMPEQRSAADPVVQVRARALSERISFWWQRIVAHRARATERDRS